jgi:hypothetical protein
MQTLILLTLSTTQTKKYDATIFRYPENNNFQNPRGKKITFGAKGYSDYTIHKDDYRKNNYIKRHQVNEDWEDLEKAGTWSRFLLWNKPTLTASIKDMERRFNIKIIDMTE